MNFRTDILPLKDKLFRMALRITMQREEAEDVVQEVMIKLWNNRENWPNIENIESYAMTVCRNLSLDHLRKKNENTVSFDEADGNMRIAGGRSARPVAEPSGGNPYEHIFAKEQLRMVYELMQQLPEKQRTCMQLRDFEGKNYKEIASIMGITEDQVKINIYRARNFIKKSCTQV